MVTDILHGHPNKISVAWSNTATSTSHYEPTLRAFSGTDLESSINDITGGDATWRHEINSFTLASVQHLIGSTLITDLTVDTDGTIADVCIDGLCYVDANISPLSTLGELTFPPSTAARHHGNP